MAILPTAWVACVAGILGILEESRALLQELNQKQIAKESGIVDQPQGGTITVAVVAAQQSALL